MVYSVFDVIGAQAMNAANSNERMITAQQLAQQAGEPYDTLNHWARMGLLPYNKKGKTRLFKQRASIARCKQIRKLQNQDLNLAAIRRILGAGKGKRDKRTQ